MLYLMCMDTDEGLLEVRFVEATDYMPMLQTWNTMLDTIGDSPTVDECVEYLVNKGEVIEYRVNGGDIQQPNTGMLN